MLTELAQVGAGWPLVASLAVAVGTRGMFEGRRRSALNEALHELRRPIQALTLAPGGARRPEEPDLEWSLRLASAALQRLDREINGDRAVPAREPLPARPLAEAAIGRWQGQAALAGGRLRLSWVAGDAAICGNCCEIAQALDNLIDNAIEHGGPQVVVAAAASAGELRICVSDCGRSSRPPSRRGGPVEVIARLSGRRRHGHGLRVVRRVAADHGGSFELRIAESRTEAVLVLPLLDRGRE